MPELPEVETIVSQLRKNIIGQKIDKVEIMRTDQWKQNDPDLIPKQIKRKTIKEINRKGKFIVIDFADDCQLVIHLRMTGKLIWSNQKPDLDAYSRTIIYFKSGSSLQFNDTRALGTLVFLNCDEKDNWQKNFGLEPLSEDWQLERLESMIRKSKLDVKSFLMDQSKIAGIGNIYANEILFRCKIHPQRRVDTLSDAEIKTIFEFVPDVLRAAVEKMGTSLGNGKQNFRSLYNIEGEFQKMIMVYGREGEPCYSCGSEVQRIRQKQRSSFFCKKCQPLILLK